MTKTIFLATIVVTVLGLATASISLNYTAEADHGGGALPDCASDNEVHDPNSGMCVPSDDCPNGVVDDGAGPHCALVGPSQAVGGEFVGIDSTMVLVAGTQTTAAWMIPAVVSAAGIAIVIGRKFSKYQPE